MASRLFGIARMASDYARRRFSRNTRDADQQIDGQPRSVQATSIVNRLSDYILGRGRSRRRGQPDRIDIPDNQQRQPPGTPPQPPPPPQTPPPPDWRQPPTTPPPPPESDDQNDGPRSVPPRPVVSQPEDEEYDEIQLLGRDATYHEDDWKVVMEKMRRTPNSSNVYGYYYERESRTTGILYVTFLADGEGSGTGSTYAYYTVPARKFHEFQAASASSAGGAVWDYLRVRGTNWQHQYNYRLVQVSGEYVPRKATRRGFARRAIADHGIGRRAYRRNTRRAYNDARPNRGDPNRGEPNRGR